MALTYRIHLDDAEARARGSLMTVAELAPPFPRTGFRFERLNKVSWWRDLAFRCIEIEAHFKRLPPL